MMGITDTQIDKIAAYLTENGFVDSRTKNELLDHLTILVELEMAEGEHFDSAFASVLKTHYPSGLHQLKKALVEWDSYPRFLTYRFVMISGVVLMILMAFGLYLKWNGHFIRGRLFVFADQITSNIYLPLLLIFLLLRFRNKTLLIFGFIALQTSNIALLAYIQDWYSAIYLMPVGIMILLSFLIYLFYAIKNRQI